MQFLTQEPNSADCMPIAVINYVRYAGGDWDYSDVAWLKQAMDTQHDGTPMFNFVGFASLLAPRAVVTFVKQPAPILKDLRNGRSIILGFSYLKKGTHYSHVAFIYKKDGKFYGTNIEPNTPEVELTEELISAMVKLTVTLDKEVVYVSFPRR